MTSLISFLFLQEEGRKISRGFKWIWFVRRIFHACIHTYIHPDSYPESLRYCTGEVLQFVLVHIQIERDNRQSSNLVDRKWLTMDFGRNAMWSTMSVSAAQTSQSWSPKSSFNNDNYLPNYIWPTYVYKLSSSIWLSMGSLSFERLWSDLFILLVQCSSQRISITLKLELHEFGLNPSYDWPDKEERAPSRGEVSFYRNVIQGQKMSPS